MTLNVVNATSGPVNISIIDVRGRHIKTIVVDNQITTLEQTIRTDGLGRGAYFLMVEFNAQQKPMVLPFVVN
jgi:hypothetical protein